MVSSVDYVTSCSISWYHLLRRITFIVPFFNRAKYLLCDCYSSEIFLHKKIPHRGILVLFTKIVFAFENLFSVELHKSNSRHRCLSGFRFCNNIQCVISSACYRLQCDMYHHSLLFWIRRRS
jgi:hypothetical protein